MRRRVVIFTPAVLGVALGVLAACQTRHETPPPTETTTSEVPNHPAAPVANAAVTRPASHMWEARGVRVTVPAGWQEKKNPDYELYLVPPGVTSSPPDEDERITFDVPDLPPHLPFMLQMSRIEHDYEADLRKTHPDRKVDEAGDAKIPEATARLVKSSWHQNGVRHEDVALLIVHANGVYILGMRAGEKRLVEVTAAYEGVRQSMQWAK